MSRNYYSEINLHFVDLEWAKNYVRNQRERHSTGKVEDRLERIAAVEIEAEAEQREGP